MWALLNQVSPKNGVLEATGLEFGASGLDLGRVWAQFWSCWNAPKQVLKGPGPTYGLFFEKPVGPTFGVTCWQLWGCHLCHFSSFYSFLFRSITLRATPFPCISLHSIRLHSNALWSIRASAGCAKRKQLVFLNWRQFKKKIMKNIINFFELTPI